MSCPNMKRAEAFTVKDGINQALTALAGTVRALHAVDLHIDEDEEGKETCRNALMRLLLADLGSLEEAERRAWRPKAPAMIEGD
jgi:hypothetical protein